ncbi:MAG: metallophosphoesterase family protein [Lachnospiraceae bacterium]|nr:metallophosphoesterase family protein [Lachnospiraceae bacterium]
MGYYKRITNAFENALRLPLSPCTKYVLLSDCHRGNGTNNDNFLKNQNLYFAALDYYFKKGFCYIELGDGDELWENRSFSQITEIHSNTFWLLSRFYDQNRFYSLYGNHDMCKKDAVFCTKKCCHYYCDSTDCHVPLFPQISFPESIILENCTGGPNLYLTHGHQADMLNSTFWKLSRFLVRYVWRHLEGIGFLDPTSAAKNYTWKKKTEKRLSQWCKQEQRILIAGHTHRPSLPLPGAIPYCNTGSCVHPRCITAIEIEHMALSLVKWTYETRFDYTLIMGREVLAGPVNIAEYAKSFNS